MGEEVTKSELWAIAFMGRPKDSKKRELIVTFVISLVIEMEKDFQKKWRKNSRKF